MNDTLQDVLIRIDDDATQLLWNLKYKIRNVDGIKRSVSRNGLVREDDVYDVIRSFDEEISQADLKNNISATIQKMDEVTAELHKYTKSVEDLNKTINKKKFSTGLQKLARTQVKKNMESGRYSKKDIPEFVHPIIDANDRVLDSKSKSNSHSKGGKTKKARASRK
jgi:hypothetical protein